jgi:hypothetical protein
MPSKWTYSRRSGNIFLYHCFCVEYILGIPIISILLVIQLTLLRADISIFVATDKHLRISDMALLREFMHQVDSHKYATY